jgi:hypothetical protein
MYAASSGTIAKKKTMREPAFAPKPRAMAFERESQQVMGDSGFRPHQPPKLASPDSSVTSFTHPYAVAATLRRDATRLF